MRAAGAADLSPLAEAAVRAFRTDPIHRWLLPTEREWRRWSPAFWRAFVRRGLAHGPAYTTDGRAGVALWCTPGAPHPPLLAELPFNARMALALRHRMVRGLRIATILERRRPREPHWYLSLLATDPAHQGRGVASALLRHTLARADAEGAFAYLECSNPANVPIYARHGFRVVHEVAVLGGPPLWLMRREPGGRG